jgi:hypothetical protein
MNSHLKKIIQQSSEPPQVIVQKSLPAETINIFDDLKQLPKFKHKVKTINKSLDNQQFIKNVNEILSLYDHDELYLSFSLVKWLMNEIEVYILNKKSGNEKRNLLTILVLPFFDNNEKYVEQMIQIAFSELIQCHGFSRFLRKSSRWILKQFKKKVEN